MARLTSAQMALSTFAHAASSMALVAARRPFAGPRRPSWTWTYEVVVETFRSRFRREVALDRARRDYDSIADLEDRKARVRVEAVDGAGCAAEWVVPHAASDSGLVMFYLHGGGYVMGSPRSHRMLMADLACATGARALGVDYRLAPEHPCPAAIEDAVRAWRWLVDTHDPKRVVMAGDSAGGGLVLATLLALRDAALPLPAAAVTLSPWADLRGPFRTSAYDYLPAPHLEEFAGMYASELSRDDPRASPLLGDLAGLPPLYISAGGEEVLLPSIEELAERARRAGVDVTFVVEADEVHVYPAFTDFHETARRAISDISRWIRERVGV